MGNVLANIFILIFPLYSYPQGRDGVLYAVPSLFLYARMCYDKKQIHPDFAAEWSTRCFGCGNSRYRISVPEEYADRIIGDLTAIRAVYDVPVIQNRVFTAEARIPVAEAMDYTSGSHPRRRAEAFCRCALMATRPAWRGWKRRRNGEARIHATATDIS